MKHFGEVVFVLLQGWIVIVDQLISVLIPDYNASTKTPATPTNAQQNQRPPTPQRNMTPKTSTNVDSVLKLNNLPTVDDVGKPPLGRPKRKVPVEIARNISVTPVLRKQSPRPNATSRTSSTTNPQTSPRGSLDRKSSQSAAALGMAILQRTRSGGQNKSMSAEAIKTLIEKVEEPMPEELEDIPDASVVEPPTITENVSDKTFLDAIIRNASTSDVTDLITLYNANIDATDRMGQSALHHAAQNGNGGLVKVLLENGADCDVIANNNGWTALHWAAQGGHLTIVQMLALFVKDVDIVDKSGWTPLLLAANNGFAEIVSELIAKGALLERRTDAGLTPLLLSARASSTDVVKVLCEAGADLEAISTHEETKWRAIHWAVQNDAVEIVRTLLDTGADVNAVTIEGLTPLMIACMIGNAVLVDLLMRHGAYKGKKNNEGQTAIQIAISRGHTDLPQLIKMVDKEIKEEIYDYLDTVKHEKRKLETDLQKANERILKLEEMEKERSTQIESLIQKTQEQESDIQAFMENIQKLQKIVESQNK